MHSYDTIVNVVHNYNFFVTIYNETVKKLDTDKEADLLYKKRLELELQKEKIQLDGLVEGYNMISDEKIQLQPDNTYAIVDIIGASFFNRNVTCEKFTISTLKFVK